MSSYPNILERGRVGAKMAVTATQSNFLCRDGELILRNIFLPTVKQLTKVVTIFRF